MTEKALVDFIKTVNTSTRYLEFASDEALDKIPPALARHIEELESLLCRLSLEAEAHLVRLTVRGRK